MVSSLLAWLKSHGLEQYLSAFERHGIDLRSLPLLSDGDLAELGVLLGHRKLILKIAKEFERSAPSASAPDSKTSLRLDAERRQITVLFCDLVGSTQLSQELDPEPLRDLMRLYQQTCGVVIEKYAGHVAQYLGDGLMVYFGWPQAHEDDAERAVRAGLDIITAIRRIPASRPLSVRIGIATGPVVVGETGDGDASVPKAAVGETPNLAARAQSLAHSDELIIAPVTRHLLGETFEYADMGDHTLKGIAAPVRLWKVLGAGKAEGRFEATRRNKTNALVGREQEIGLLLDRWQQARDGEGQVVLLAGEPGIGKSRVTDALREMLSSHPHTRLRYQCSPYHTGSAFYPIITQFERAAAFNRDDASSVRLRKMEAALDLDVQALGEVAPLIAALLSLPVDTYPPRALSPQKQKELTIAALVDQALRLTRSNATLMILEDAHWIDPSSLETFGQIVDRMRDAAILLVITHRPELVSPWKAHSHATTLSLNRLPRRQATAIVTQVTGGKTLPEEVLAQILSKTDGIPLFIEELTKTVLEAGYLKEQEHAFVLDGPLPPMGIPATLRDSLMSRLDRLGEAKEVAQLGACIGRDFSQELLGLISSMSAGALTLALDRLVDSGLVFRRGQGDETFYTFKHALVQDCAYESLLNSRRQQLHARIAQELAARFPAIAQAQPELLALHFTRAGMHDAAGPRWLTAAHRAAGANRFREGVAHIEAGLAIVERISASQRVNLEAALLVTGGFCHMAMAGYSSAPAAALFARVETLLDSISDTFTLDTALWAVGVLAWVRADFPKAYATYERLANLADQSGDLDRRMLGYFCFGTLLNQVAQYERGRRMLEFVVENYDPQRHARFIYTMGHDLKAVVCAWLSMICSSQGMLDQARRYARLGVEQAKAVSHPFSLTEALSNGALAFAEAADCDEAIAMCRECHAVCEAQSLPFWAAVALTAEGVARYQNGEYRLTLSLLKDGMERHSGAGARAAWGRWYAWRAMALAKLGDLDQARAESELSLKYTAESGEISEKPMGAYARGVVESLVPRQPTAVAEHWFRIAIDESRSQSNLLVELRAAISLARIWRDNGKPREAHALLAPIHVRFTEGFDARDWREGRDLLIELST